MEFVNLRREKLALSQNLCYKSCSMETEKEQYMRHAIELARKGEGWTNPNPLVGAVIVKDGKIIGEGYHHRYGELHAEREALKDCAERGNSADGAEIYVTLEPCCHYGKQPPCCEAVAAAGIRKVYVGSRDPNPLVSGKGNEFLRGQGIEVETDVLRSECDALNDIFFHYISTKTPYVALKYAMTLDGKIATRTGKSKWITGETSRAQVQKLRHRYAGILVGIGTVLADDPMLNCRLQDSEGNLCGNNPVRIICDSHLRLPVDCNLVRTAREVPVIDFCLKSELTKEENQSTVTALRNAGVDVIGVDGGYCADEGAVTDDAGHISIPLVLAELGQRNIDSVLVEGGSEINYAFLESGCVHCIYAFVAPKLFGGQAKGPVAGAGVELPDQAFTFNLTDTQMFDGDIMLTYIKN